jgi:hypothetical protein
MQPSETAESREDYLARIMQELTDRDRQERAWLAQAIAAVAQATGSNDQRLATAQAALTLPNTTIETRIHWWDTGLMRQLLIRAACPIFCRGARDPEGEDWHALCEDRADKALALLGGSS